PPPVVHASGSPERLSAQLAMHDAGQALRVWQPLALAVKHHLKDRSPLAQVPQRAVSLPHVLLVQTVVGLVDPAYEADLGVRCQPHPHLHVPGMGQPPVIAAYTLLQRRAHDDLRRCDGVLPLPEPVLDPPLARPHRPTPHPRPRRREWRAVADPHGTSIHESGAGVGVQEIPGAPQGSRGEPVVCRHQSAIVTVSPIDQAFIEGRDIALVGLVDDYLYTGVASRDLPGHLGAVISRGVVDDEHSHVDTLLVIQHAADDVLKEMTVFVTRNNDAN